MSLKGKNETLTAGHYARELKLEDIIKLKSQDSKLVSKHVADKLELEARKNWDLFYKRNEDRFFKDRHWTRREFEELVQDGCNGKRMLEVGCGAGNLMYPLLEEGCEMFMYACDLSPRAIDLVKAHVLYSEKNIKAFQTDITTDEVLKEISEESLDIVTLIFVLSSIHPCKFHQVLRVLYRILKPRGVILFRDYGLYDMAQLRFKPGHKIADNLYMRQDGTRSYYFSEEYLAELLVGAGFEIVSNTYIQRRTVNKKDGIDVPRIFIQAKAKKPVVPTT
uniref:tRNA N(3)-methylcytidine methyltransferase n=1 Tax=Timema tahoe TaxID=61484 RepID=A0A7R9NZY5_9NEOP|nr:unnamed protein product [Timema tahoe]